MDKEAVGMGDLLALINDYGRACRRDGNPAWESYEGRALKAALAQQPAAQAAGLTDAEIIAIYGEHYFDCVDEDDRDPSHILPYTRAIERALLSRAAPSGEPVANNEAYDLAYDKIDRFLRNNLNDDDYAEFSQALDSLAAPQPSGGKHE